ncbi:MAG TPA: hypothetical protein VKA60_04375 [Blastocatellia bacterium]|nr:hypothetical protein [Blastocatellia bacterium]
MAQTTHLAVERRESAATTERSAEAIRQDIAAKRDSISETVNKLGERVQETLDWREYVGKYPLLALGLAAGAGFLVAGLFKHEPTPRERIMDAVAEIAEDFADRARDVMGEALPGKTTGPTMAIKAAVTGAIAKAAIDFGKRKAGELLAGNQRQPVRRV